MRKIEHLGISVESVKGKGYRLTKKLSLLTSQKIENSLAADVLANTPPKLPSGVLFAETINTSFILYYRFYC